MQATEPDWVTYRNPLDGLEELVAVYNWNHERTSDFELVIELHGHWCDYFMYCVWDEELGALHLSCLFETRVTEERRNEVHHLLALINERLWIGHFDLCSGEGTLMFRHTMLVGGNDMVTARQFEELAKTLVREPDRYYPAFQYVIWGGKSAPEAVSAAMVDVVGQA